MPYEFLKQFDRVFWRTSPARSTRVDVQSLVRIGGVGGYDNLARANRRLHISYFTFVALAGSQTRRSKPPTIHHGPISGSPPTKGDQHSLGNTNINFPAPIFVDPQHLQRWPASSPPARSLLALICGRNLLDSPLCLLRRAEQALHVRT